jgi:hypothetical protein
MAAALVVLEEENRRGLRRERVFRDLVHPQDAFDDIKLFERYRMPRPVLLEMLDSDIAHPTNRSHCALQVLTAIRFYAKGSSCTWITLIHISQPSVYRIVTRVSAATNFIAFPRDLAVQERISEEFYTNRNRIPNVLGCVDGSLVGIRSTSDHEETYVCRRGYHALNIQGVCTADMKFTNIVIVAR